MGERLASQKSYVCSFFDCKAKFSKSWKLEAHLCKHTGLVSGFALLEAKENNDKDGSGRLVSADIHIFLPLIGQCCQGIISETFLLPQKPFSCERCDKSFCTRYQLTRHELNHSGEKPYKYVVTFRCFCFERLEFMFLKLLFQLLPVLVFRCLVDGCPEAFVTNASMKNHKARVHDKQEKQYQVQLLGPVLFDCVFFGM